MAKKRAFVKYTKQGRLIPGSLIVTTKGGYPVDGLYTEVPTNICCDKDDPGTITSSPKGWVRYTKKGAIVPGSLILGESHPKNGVWKEVTIDLCCAESTTTTTTAAPVNSTLSVDISVAPQLFDIPFGTSNFGCWVKVTDPAGFPRLFSIGQYPNAYQAISIEGGTLYFWYNGVIQVSYSLTSYVGNWVWISVMGDGSGGITVWVNGVDVVSVIIPIPTAMTNTMYIGSENAPATYLIGNMASVIFDINRDLRFPPTSPLVTTGGTALLIGQGFDLNSQTTNQGAVGVVSNTNCTYSTDSPYPPGNGGSIQFG